MIKILYITPNFTIGGTEGQIFNLVTHLNRSRFTPYVISTGSDQGQRALYSENNIETKVFKITKIINIVSFIKEKRIDIVHSFYYGDFSGWELLAAKLAGVKIFITSRRNMGYWRKWRHLLFDIFRNSFTDLIIANSYAVRKQTIKDEKLGPSKVIVIYNGVDVSKFSGAARPELRMAIKKEFGIGEKEKVIGMISNIKYIKGYEYFLGAARIIKDWGYKARFVVAGEGSETETFKSMVNEYGLGDSLIPLGLCRDVSRLFSIIDVFMYSSLSEGFPNVVLEAMAAEKPIVATNVGGTGEMLRDGYSGLLVSPRHVKALARAVSKILEDEVMMRQLRETAQKAVKDYFGLERCIKRYETIYKELYRKKVGEDLP